jgi:hypothetical protein
MLDRNLFKTKIENKLPFSNQEFPLILNWLYDHIIELENRIKKLEEPNEQLSKNRRGFGFGSRETL